MALERKKQVVIYGAVAVIVLGALVMGGLAWSGRLKIKADVPTQPLPDGANNMSRWLLPGRWNLVAIPCPNNNLPYHLGSTYWTNARNLGYQARYDTGSGDYIAGYDIKSSDAADSNYFSIGHAYWIKADAKGNNILWTTCTLPTGAVTVPLKVGQAQPVGNPYGSYLHVWDIKLMVDGTEIPLTTAIKDKKVQLAFYRAGHWTDNPSTDTSAYTMVASSFTPGGSYIDPLTKDAPGGVGADELAPFAGFYIAVAPSLGSSTVDLKFNYEPTRSTACADECAVSCNAWGEKSDVMVEAHKAYCAAR